MDKSWLKYDRLSDEYEAGVEKFIKTAVESNQEISVVRCPCDKCQNLAFHRPKEVKDHLIIWGLDMSYKTWVWHGEDIRNKSPDNIGCQNDSGYMDYDGGNTVEMVEDAFKDCDSDLKALKKLLEDSEKPLYPGSNKFTKLSALVKLYNIKGRYGWSDSSFSDLLSALSDMLPEGNDLPVSMYKAKQTMSALGLEYIKIHACPNDCILYRKEYESLSNCPTCGESRWKKRDGSVAAYRKGVPTKVLWYFPPIPRFRRLFQSSQTAKDLTWHINEREIDGKLRHPADSPAWKLVDEKWPTFALEPRNLRLALSADGINPHSSLSSTYSCWPILLVTYNLPPWLCMKRKFMMLSLLISGPQQPGNDIDVYLAPLIEDLQTLWDVGVEAYDAYKKEFFNLRAVLLWTINDFPAYGNLAGCTVKGYYACPYCGEDMPKCRLKHSKKIAYIGHRRWLPHDHPFRTQKKPFNNKHEREPPPKPLNSEAIFRKVESIENKWGKVKDKKRKKRGEKKDDDDDRVWWKKKSIFFKLEYWKYLLIRHQLDVMHIEKNVCESIYGTLLNIPGKTKDGIKSRWDLKVLKIRQKLAPDVKENNRTFLPPACYTLTKEEKKRFCEVLKSIKVPVGYSSNIQNLVSMKDLKLQGLKSHDCHVLMQQLLPIALRSILPDHVKYAIIRLCFFFNSLCATVVDVTKLDQMEEDIALTLCLLEKCFPPSFFDIMIHLTIHLVNEVRLCGPVYLRWMYPFERNMKGLKAYVRNRNNPEGCIAESYIAEEALEFCAKYVSNMRTIGLPPGHVETSSIDKPLPGGKFEHVDHSLIHQAHLYVLQNTEEVQPFISEHIQWLKGHHSQKAKNERWLSNEHNRTFSTWLNKKVYEMIDDDEDVSNILRWLSQGPRPFVVKHPGYDINGYRFHTRE
ncbi:uncharacterized protein LOC112100875 [Citrus clementina]|uniref:uncharacterized protein LOC112100875 n=1 Tax=Citrus clementina TaxID=85681 RepID=UPI000CED1C51|nr:uncharacterized protein LOC112100875 [Citrus x clementina]